MLRVEGIDVEGVGVDVEGVGVDVEGVDVDVEGVDVDIEDVDVGVEGVDVECWKKLHTKLKIIIKNKCLPPLTLRLLFVFAFT